MPFVQELETEIKRLETELSRDPRQVKLRQLQHLRTLYKEDETCESPSSLAAMYQATPSTGRKEAESTRAVLDAVRLYLKGKKTPVRTAEIFDHVVGLGIEISGASPQNNLSAMLSRADEFLSHQRKGWTLRSEASLGDILGSIVGEVTPAGAGEEDQGDEPPSARH